MHIVLILLCLALLVYVGLFALAQWQAARVDRAVRRDRVEREGRSG